jgi:mRNA interferase YafQ
MRLAAYSGQFKRDIKLAQKRGKDMEKLKQAMRLLIGAVSFHGNIATIL